jgi:hypothetical protein
VLSAAARLNASKTAVPRTPDAPEQLKMVQLTLSGSEGLAGLTCNKDVHFADTGTAQLTDSNRTTITDNTFPQYSKSPGGGQATIAIRYCTEADY